MRNNQNITIRPMKKSDWNAVSKIYAEGIATGIATFEKEIPTYESWNSSHLNTCRLIAEQNNTVLGWAALSPVSSRCVYGGVAEVSVYINAISRGQGVGSKLMQSLIISSEKEGLWTLQSGIFPENIGSCKLHKKSGFRYIGKRERVGKIDGLWKDNLLYERRSTIIGVA
ncbi:N-acetyltransferase family protein [Aurantibacter sp.]|uniref:GNAT family N-acetyltransferase n=1 Tax=Aurantibacter sp. TaxID=2807103 RepID=UPI0032664692